MRKAFGRVAGRVALASMLGALAALFGLLELIQAPATLPTMAALGPLMVLQYRYWRRRGGAERTTWQFRQGEPRAPRPAGQGDVEGGEVGSAERPGGALWQAPRAQR
jgi:hypothetical protein